MFSTCPTSVAKSPKEPQRSGLQRVDGHARVHFGREGIRDLEQVAPARFLFPDQREGDFSLAVTVTTSGGLTGGDRLRFEVTVDPQACATVVPQSAEKLYRALPDDPPTLIEARIVAGDGSCCEWVSQEVILFDRSRMRRSLEIDLSGDARVLAVELVVFGRQAMGEVFSEGFVHDCWRIRRDGRLIWVDGLHIEGDFAETCAAPFGFGGARAMLTLVHAAPDAERHLDLARSLAGDGGGATAFDGLLILRVIGADVQEVRRSGVRATEALRAAIFGLRPVLPSLCYC